MAPPSKPNKSPLSKGKISKPSDKVVCPVSMAVNVGLPKIKGGNDVIQSTMEQAVLTSEEVNKFQKSSDFASAGEQLAIISVKEEVDIAKAPDATVTSSGTSCSMNSAASVASSSNSQNATTEPECLESSLSVSKLKGKPHTAKKPRKNQKRKPSRFIPFNVYTGDRKKPRNTGILKPPKNGKWTLIEK